MGPNANSLDSWFSLRQHIQLPKQRLEIVRGQHLAAGDIGDLGQRFRVDWLADFLTLVRQHRDRGFERRRIFSTSHNRLVQAVFGW